VRVTLDESALHLFDAGEARLERAAPRRERA
jgi:hypothetical protein